MALTGILGAIVFFVLMKIFIRLVKSVGKDIMGSSGKKEIIDDINTKSRTRKNKKDGIIK
jgi:hypothetical protein